MKSTFIQRLILGGILLLAFTAKSPIITNELINRDDPAYITENELIRDVSPGGIYRIFATPDYMADYHPVTLSFFAVEYALFGTDPRGYHSASILLYLLITTLVFFFIRRLSGSFTVAALTTAIFAVHPLHVEAVAWASAQKDLVYGSFFLCSLVAYLKFLQEGRSRSFYLLSLACFVLALLAKMMAAPLPIALLLIDYFLQRKFSRSVIVEKLPFFSAAIVFGLVELYAHRAIAPMLDEIVYGGWGRFVLASVALIGYLGKLVAPLSLSAYYPFPFPPGDIPPSYLLYVVMALALFGGALLTFRSTRAIFFGVSFFIVNVFVILQIVPAVGAFMADRYAFIASIGIFFILAHVIGRALASYARFRGAILGVMVSLLLVAGVSAWNRAHVWKNGVTLWTDVLGQFPDVAFIYVYRANARPVPQEYDAALADVARAIVIEPDLGIAHYSRAFLLAGHGDHAAAVSGYTKAIELKYQPVRSFINRGSSLTALGKLGDAISDYSSAIQLDASQSDAYFNRGNVFLQMGEYAKAVEDYTLTMKLSPSDAETYYNSGVAKLQLGRREEACRDFTQSANLGYPRAFPTLKEYCR